MKNQLAIVVVIVVLLVAGLCGCNEPTPKENAGSNIQNDDWNPSSTHKDSDGDGYSD